MDSRNSCVVQQNRSHQSMPNKIRGRLKTFIDETIRRQATVESFLLPLGLERKPLVPS